jgi:hypothetical protein
VQREEREYDVGLCDVYNTLPGGFITRAKNKYMNEKRIKKVLHPLNH